MSKIFVLDTNKQPLDPINPARTAFRFNKILTHFCITFHSTKYDKPQHLAKHENNLKRKQKNLARQKKGSNSRQKARRLVAKVNSKIVRCRENFLHKLSRKLVNENQVIAVENLNIKGMVSKRNLAKSISDCRWGMFCRMLESKAENEGKTYIEVDRWFPSSKTCSACLNRASSLPLDVRSWTCDRCPAKHDRDINASINIINEALRIFSLGTNDTANRGHLRRLGGKIYCLLDAMPDEVRSPNYIACN